MPWVLLLLSLVSSAVYAVDIPTYRMPNGTYIPVPSATQFGRAAAKFAAPIGTATTVYQLCEALQCWNYLTGKLRDLKVPGWDEPNSPPNTIAPSELWTTNYQFPSSTQDISCKTYVDTYYSNTATFDHTSLNSTNTGSCYFKGNASGNVAPPVGQVKTKTCPPGYSLNAQLQCLLNEATYGTAKWPAPPLMGPEPLNGPLYVPNSTNTGWDKHPRDPTPAPTVPGVDPRNINPYSVPTTDPYGNPQSVTVTPSQTETKTQTMTQVENNGKTATSTQTVTTTNVDGKFKDVTLTQADNTTLTQAQSGQMGQGTVNINFPNDYQRDSTGQQTNNLLQRILDFFTGYELPSDNPTLQDEPYVLPSITVSGSGGSCPSDPVAHTTFGDVPFPLRYICTLAEYIRPMVIALSLLASVFIVFSGSSNQD